MDSKLLLTTNEAAKRMGISRTALYDLIRTRRLKSVKLGGRRFIPNSALEDAVSVLIEETEEAA